MHAYEYNMLKYLNAVKFGIKQYFNTKLIQKQKSPHLKDTCIIYAAISVISFNVISVNHLNCSNANILHW